MIKREKFSLLLTPDYILDENHYLKKDGLNPKGKGIERILFSDDIEQYPTALQTSEYTEGYCSFI